MIYLFEWEELKQKHTTHEQQQWKRNQIQIGYDLDIEREGNPLITVAL